MPETVARGELRPLRNPVVTRNSLHDAARVDNDGLTGFSHGCAYSRKSSSASARIGSA